VENGSYQMGKAMMEISNIINLKEKVFSNVGVWSFANGNQVEGQY